MPMKYVVRLRLLALSALMLLCTQAAYASSDDGRFVIKGMGQQTCQVFTQEREKKSDAYVRFIGWFEGFISHYNQYTPDTTDVMSWQNMQLLDLLLTNFCIGNPTTQFAVAVETMVNALHPTRLRNVSEVIQIEGSDPPILLYRAVIQRIQQTLTERGFYIGAIDGDYGSGTANAMKKFQAEANIAQTGMPDQITLLRLFQ